LRIYFLHVKPWVRSCKMGFAPFWVAFVLLAAASLQAETLHQMASNGIRIFFDPRLKQVATQLTGAYPHIKGEIEAIFDWKLKGVPSLILVSNGSQFEKIAGSPYIIAFARPEEGLIVMDWSKLKRSPSHIHDVFKHELCHLLIHQHINADLVPRWLDEGVAQWASDGIADVILEQKGSLLDRAAFNGRFIPLRRLSRGFPEDKEGLALAYEESKDFIEYIVGRYGKAGLLALLRRMQQGETVSQAAGGAFSVPLVTLEADWQKSLEQKVTWFTYLSYYLYEILFGLGGFLLCFAAMKVFLRKRAYMKAEVESLGNEKESGAGN